MIRFYIKKEKETDVTVYYFEFPDLNISATILIPSKFHERHNNTPCSYLLIYSTIDSPELALLED